jgi:hypothetical protein
MAALTAANVRLIRSWTEGGLNNKKRRVRHVEVYGGTWGGATNTMPAAAFALSTIEEVSPAVYGLKGFHLAPKTDGSVVYAFDTVGASSAPADIVLPTTPNGLYFTVKGY